MKAARDAVLGPRELRTREKPILVDGVYKDGTHWERHKQAIHVSTSERCYTLVNSYQSPRNLIGPAVGAKIGMDEEPTWHLRLREQVIKVCVGIVTSDDV